MSASADGQAKLRVWWPIGFRVLTSQGAWKVFGAHGWRSGFDARNRETVYGMTLHLGPIKLVFGDDAAPARSSIFRAIAWLLVGRCRHPSMRADLLEGDSMVEYRPIVPGQAHYAQIRWCPDCGATAVDRMVRGSLRTGELRIPRRAGGLG